MMIDMALGQYEVLLDGKINDEGIGINENRL